MYTFFSDFQMGMTTLTVPTSYNVIKINSIFSIRIHTIFKELEYQRNMNSVTR